jgi:hypothetical protein
MSGTWANGKEALMSLVFTEVSRLVTPSTSKVEPGSAKVGK